MRNISFNLTQQHIRDRTKTVTRRLGWTFLKPGDRLQGCVKCMGLRPGEKIQKLAVVEVVSVRREPLNELTRKVFYGVDEVLAEGFPEKTPEQFVQMFCDHMNATRMTTVTRIEFKYV